MDSLPLLKIKFENYTDNTAFKKFREKKVGGISCLSSQQNHYYPLVFCSYDSLLCMFSECGHILGLHKVYILLFSLDICIRSISPTF